MEGTGAGGDSSDTPLMASNGMENGDEKEHGESQNDLVADGNTINDVGENGGDLTMDSQEDDELTIKNYNQLLTDLSYNSDTPCFHAKTRWEQVMDIPRFTKDQRCVSFFFRLVQTFAFSNFAFFVCVICWVDVPHTQLCWIV